VTTCSPADALVQGPPAACSAIPEAVLRMLRDEVPGGEPAHDAPAEEDTDAPAADSEHLTIPALWCPIEPSLNPRHRELDAGCIAWMARMGLASDAAQFQRWSRIKSGELAARTVEPDAAGPGPQFAADHLQWLFTFDDVYCDEGIYGDDPAGMALLIADLMRIVETGSPHLAGLSAMRAMQDLRQRAEAIATPVQISRWVNAMRAYLGYQVWEAAHRARRSVPSVDSYLMARIANGSMPVCTAMLDFTSNFEIAADEAETPAVRALNEMCCALVGLDNDLMSHWKETVRGGGNLNLIDVLAVENRCGKAEAVTLAVSVRERILYRFLRLKDQIMPSMTSTGERYLTLLASWIRGNIDWSMSSGRYRNPADPAALPDAIAPGPATPDLGPLPYPSIAWWWSPSLTATPVIRGAATPVIRGSAVLSPRPTGLGTAAARWPATIA
jgi:hypothetical protein